MEIVFWLIFMFVIFGGLEWIAYVYKEHWRHKERMAKIQNGIDPDKTER